MSGSQKGLAAVAVLGLAVAVYIARMEKPPAPPLQPVPTAAPAAVEAPAFPLPTLAESDPLVREKAAALFSGARLAEWLKTGSLLRRLTAAVRILAEGGSPRDALGFLRPTGRFPVKKAAGKVLIDPRGYARYDAVAGTFASADAQALAALLRAFDPLFRQACAELDETCDFRAQLLLAIDELLRVPVVEGDVLLREKVVTYAFADEALERLSPAQKHLLRMGPKNQAKIQGKLHELAAALGAPRQRL